ncbi:uncharacterized protein LOC131882507 [Tigriopus californicus]|uniref:uncharacterized protein LOC131882507 n=1 Tax=Tigriopus californicus TaxID=6832 RepID=UPI0027DAABC6|nr:uncharacterized protein LOC131882507 [Tigriopus californicus]
MGYEYQSQLVEKPRDFMLTMEIEKGTLNWKEVPCPSDLKMLPLSNAIRLSDGRIWLYDYKKRHTVLFDGENFLPSVEPIWVKNGYGLMGAAFGRVHNDYIIAVGATRYDFETKESIANQTLSIFMLDVNRNESKTVQVIPNKYLIGASIWSVIQDEKIKVLIGGGRKSPFEPDPSLIVVELKSGDITILESSAHYLPTKERNVRFTAIVMIGQEPYYVQKNSSVAKITNLQDFADGKGDKNTIFVPGASWFLKGLQFADVDDWLSEDTP